MREFLGTAMGVTVVFGILLLVPVISIIIDLMFINDEHGQPECIAIGIDGLILAVILWIIMH